jgi:steroid delta-isomerase-like uncharacterized protein
MRRMTTIAPAVALATLCLMAASCKVQPSHVAEDWVAGWSSHDVEKLAAVFTDDVFYEDVTFGDVNHGVADLRKFAASFFESVPDMHMELIRASSENAHGTIEWRLTGTDKGVYKTGKKFSVRGASVIDVREGKISRNLDFYDSAAIMRQVGLLPAETGK